MTTESTGAAKRIINWQEYNRALVKRGSLTFWFSEEVLEGWFHRGPNQGRGLNKTFSDSTIQACLMLKVLFGLSLRALEGFVESLLELMGRRLPCPHFSLFSKRAAGLEVLIKRRLPAGPLDVVIDSTGVKVYGEGEWKVRMHGVGKRRTWRKLHLAVDPNSHDVVAAALTTVEVGDGQMLPELLDQFDDNQALGQVAADGAYDDHNCYEAIERRGGRPTIPPRRTAVEWEPEHPRSAAVRACAAEGRAQWKRLVGYHRRSVAETSVYRYKQLISPTLSLRTFERQVAEAYAGIAVMNRMNTLGMPKRG